MGNFSQYLELAYASTSTHARARACGFSKRYLPDFLLCDSSIKIHSAHKKFIISHNMSNVTY